MNIGGQTLEDRYWKYVEVLGPDDCWPWLGAPDRDGYGVIAHHGKAMKATHVALTLSGKPRPGRASALHSCDNPPCQNPNHLRWGCQVENVADREARQRRVAAKGIEHPCAVLTEAAVHEIRASKEVRRAAAQRFNVSIFTIADVRARRTWRHI